ncbi:MAG: hypothetical protein IKC72_07815, partial [Clostridia bacterium]|nr:hypothetical protein [Clostridia bacterium]
PMMMKVRSERSLRYCLELIEEQMRVLGLEKDDTYIAQDFTMPYETTEELAKRGLVKVIYGEGTAPADTTVTDTLGQITPASETEQAPEAPTEEVAPVEETVVEAPAEETAPDAEQAPEILDAEPATDSHSEQSEESHSEPALNGFRPEELAVRYRHSFLSKLIQSDKELQQIYTEIKNLLLSYRGVKARMSFANETFKKAKVHISKLNVKGKSLTVELALNPENYSIQKYHFIDNSAKNPELPMMMKVRSERSLRYCLELIEEQMRVLGLEKDDTYIAQDFTMPYETTEELAKRGLVKVIYGEGTAPADTTVADTLGQITPAPDAEPTTEAPAEEVAPAEEPVIEEVTPVEEPVVEAPIEEVSAEAPAEEQTLDTEPVTEQAPETPDAEPATDSHSEQNEESHSEPATEQAPETIEGEDLTKYLPDPVAYRTNITACPATPVYIGKNILLLFKGDIVLTKKIEDEASVVFLALSRKEVLALQSKERAKLFMAIQALPDVQSAMATIRRLSGKEKLGLLERFAISRASRRMDKSTLPYFDKLLPLTEEQYTLYQCQNEIATTRVRISGASMWKALRTLGTEGIVLDDNDTGEGR